MSRKDYTEFAGMFANTKPNREDFPKNGHYYNTALQQWLANVRGACRVFQQDNSRFDEGRFLAACGVGA
jgi:hypothetical protein